MAYNDKVSVNGTLSGTITNVSIVAPGTLDTSTDYTLFTSANTISATVTNAPVWVGNAARQFLLTKYSIITSGHDRETALHAPSATVTASELGAGAARRHQCRGAVLSPEVQVLRHSTQRHLRIVQYKPCSITLYLTNSTGTLSGTLTQTTDGSGIAHFKRRPQSQFGRHPDARRRWYSIFVTNSTSITLSATRRPANW